MPPLSGKSPCSEENAEKLCRQIIADFEKNRSAKTILGLSDSHSKEQLKKAYFNLIKKIHPDKQPKDNEVLQKLAGQSFNIVNDAHKLLSFYLMPAHEQQPEDIETNLFIKRDTEFQAAENRRQEELSKRARRNFHSVYTPPRSMYNPLPDGYPGRKPNPYEHGCQEWQEFEAIRHKLKPLNRMSLAEIVSTNDIWEIEYHSFVLQQIYYLAKEELKEKKKLPACLFQYQYNVLSEVIAEEHFELFKMYAERPEAITHEICSISLAFIDKIYQFYGAKFFKMEHVYSLIRIRNFIATRYLLLERKLFPISKENFKDFQSNDMVLRRKRQAGDNYNARQELLTIFYKNGIFDPFSAYSYALSNRDQALIQLAHNIEPDPSKIPVDNYSMCNALGNTIYAGDTEMALFILDNHLLDFSKFYKYQYRGDLTDLYEYSFFYELSRLDKSKHQEGEMILEKLMTNSIYSDELLANLLKALIGDADNHPAFFKQTLKALYQRSKQNILKENTLGLSEREEIYLRKLRFEWNYCYIGLFRKQQYEVISELIPVSDEPFHHNELAWSIFSIFEEIYETPSHLAQRARWDKPLNDLISAHSHQLQYKNDSFRRLENEDYFEKVSSLHLASHLGLTSQVKALTENMHNQKISLDDPVHFNKYKPGKFPYFNTYHLSALHLALRQGHEDTAAALILRGADYKKKAVFTKKNNAFFSYFSPITREEKSVLEMAKAANLKKVIWAIQHRQLSEYIAEREAQDEYLSKIRLFGCTVLNFGYSKKQKIDAAKQYQAILLEKIENPDAIVESPELSTQDFAPLFQGRLAEITKLDEKHDRMCPSLVRILFN